MTSLLLTSAGGLVILAALAAFHVAVDRVWHHPAPLFRRTLPTRRGRAILVGFAGCAVAYLVPAFFLVTHGVLAGVPDSTVVEVVASQPAETAGLRSGDRIVTAEHVAVTSFEDLRAVLAGASESVTLEVERNGSLKTFVVEKGASGQLGVRPTIRAQSVAEALPNALVRPGEFMLTNVAGLGNMLFTTPPREVVDVAVFISEQSNYSKLDALTLASLVLLPKVLLLYVALAVLDFRGRRASQ